MNNSEAWSLMESLESRMLLAGNVTAEVVQGLLRIRGDGGANDIRVEDRGEDGIHVSGNNDTMVNGASVAFDAMDVDRGVRINLGEGDNRLSIFGYSLFGGGELVVNTGDDDDTLFLHATNTRSLVIRTRGGKDVVSLLGTDGSSGFIDTGGDADFVSLDRAFQNEWTVRTGKGDDIIFHQGLSDTRPALRAGTGHNLVTTQQIVKEYHFEKGDAQGWRAGFADYFSGREAEHELESGIVTKPYGPQTRQKFYIKSRNSTDDLFMFLTRSLTAADGLKPSTHYLLYYDVEFDSNAESGCVGVGGAPGESVYLKAGASTNRPRTTSDSEGVERLNVDHGQQANSGKATTVLGNIANGAECGTSQPPGIFIATHRTGVHRQLVRTDAKGRLHLIVGTESGFEGTTELYFGKIKVQLVEAFRQPRRPEERYVPVS